jgi:hypothetical protein
LNLTGGGRRMPTKLPHNCDACSKLSASQARQKGCWEDKRCPDRRSYHRKKAATAIRRKEQRQNSAIDTILASSRDSANAGADDRAFVLPDIYAAELCLWINRSNNTIHAIGARLYCGSVLTDRIEAIHCLGLTEAQLKQTGRNILLALSAQHDGIALAKFRVIKEFDSTLCPLTDCRDY